MGIFYLRSSLKRFGLAFIILLTTLLSADTWTCYRLIDDEYIGGSIKVEASSKSEAEEKAMKKYRELGYNLTNVDCR